MMVHRVQPKPFDSGAGTQETAGQDVEGATPVTGAGGRNRGDVGCELDHVWPADVICLPVNHDRVTILPMGKAFCTGQGASNYAGRFEG
jgi:hypothetical protein